MSDQAKKVPGLPVNEFVVPPQPPANSAKVLYGKIIPPQQQILIYSSEEWEAFINEWVDGLKPKYLKVVRLTGASDMGIDVAGLTDTQGFKGVWDNFQCKHYDAPLTPSIAMPEVGKMLWHSYNGEFNAPRAYSFMAPKGCGLSLKKLLLDPRALQAKLFEKWDDWCAKEITSTQTIKLEGDFFSYCQAYDYASFGYKEPLEVIEEHRKTPFFNVRFGGGLPARPTPELPPASPAHTESRYLHQLFDAYGDNKKATIKKLDDLSAWPNLKEHYHRQRELFYHAESLRNFARDTVPAGTFESLQDEVHAGVVEISESSHADGLERLTAVTQTAATLSLTENGLISVVKIQDRKGICHQLANVDRLLWKK